MLIPATLPRQAARIAFATLLVLWPGPARRARAPPSHAASAIVAARVLADQFDTGAVERVDHPGQRLDDAAHRADARFHPLDRRQRDACEFGERPLVNAQQRPRRPHLERRDHATIPYAKEDK